MIVSELLIKGQQALADSLSPRLDAEVLLCHVLGQNRTWLLTHAADPVDAEDAKAFFDLIERRRSGEPVAYLTGSKEFYGRLFRVTKDVLVPRPESEMLIDLAKRDFIEGGILELGTGSGCLAITLALELPHAQVTAADISAKALDVARQNAKQLKAKVDLIESDLFANIPAQTFSMIVANLPYLRPQDLDGTPTRKELEHEPALALFAQDNGLSVIKRAVLDAVHYLASKGKIYLEMLPEQIEEFVGWVKEQELPYDTEVKEDLGGVERFVVLKKNL